MNSQKLASANFRASKLFSSRRTLTTLEAKTQFCNYTFLQDKFFCSQIFTDGQSRFLVPNDALHNQGVALDKDPCSEYPGQHGNGMKFATFNSAAATIDLAPTLDAGLSLATGAMPFINESGRYHIRR